VGGGVHGGSGSPLARWDAPRVGNNGPNPPDAVNGDDESQVGYGRPFEEEGAILEVAAPLKVNATLVNQSQGLAAGVESLHLPLYGAMEAEEFFNLMAAQQFPWFLEPTLASWEGLWTTISHADITGGIFGQAFIL